MHLPKNQTQVESHPKEGIRTTMMSSTISLDDVDPSTVVLGEDSDPSLPKKKKIQVVPAVRNGESAT